MKVGIIGSGVVGQQLGHGFLRSGHQVKIGTRDQAKLSGWKKDAGQNASTGSVKEAAEFGEIIVFPASMPPRENPAQKKSKR